MPSKQISWHLLRSPYEPCSLYVSGSHFPSLSDPACPGRLAASPRPQLRWSIFGDRPCRRLAYAATPLVEDDRVILPVGGPSASMVALHVDDGRVLWTVGSDPASYCPAFPITLGGRRCIVAYLQNSLLLIEPATGKLVYRQPTSAGYDEHSAWPFFREPHLFLAAPFRQAAICSKLQPGADDLLTSRLKWTSSELCNDIVSSVLYRGQLFGFHLKQFQASRHRPSRGSFHCLDWKTGKLRWSADSVGQAALVAAFVLRLFRTLQNHRHVRWLGVSIWFAVRISFDLSGSSLEDESATRSNRESGPRKTARRTNR